MQATQITLPAGRVPGVYQPVLDLSGVLANNLISGETQTIAPNQLSPFQFIIPTYGPFFTGGFVAYKVNSNGTQTQLQLGTDYFFAFPFIGASRAIGVPIFAGIKLNGNTFTGTISIVYQTLGGSWTNTPAQIASTLLTTVTDPSAVTWEQVGNFNAPFPVVTTPWNLADSTPLTAVTTALVGLTNAIANNGINQNYNSEISHLVNFSNPHKVTLAQLNLNNVANIPPATDVSATDITNNSQYINPKQVNSMIVNLTTQATPTVNGTLKLADGTTLAQASSNLLALTASTFASYTTNQLNGIGALVNKGQVVGKFSKVPTAFPVAWNGVSYPNLSALINAVTSSLNLTGVEYNSNLGCFYFPQGTVVPNLTLS